MLRKSTSILLIFTIIFTSFPLGQTTDRVQAEGETVTLPNGNVAVLPAGVTADTTVKGYGINLDVLQERKALVFGNHTNVPDNEKKEGQWRYLGYSLSGDKYTNIDFPNDADSGRKAWEKNIIKKPWKERLTGENELARDTKANDTLESILEVNGFPSSWTAENAKDYFFIQSLKGPGLQPQIKFFHRTDDGKVWYQTLAGESEPIEIIKETSVKADFKLNSVIYEYQDTGYEDVSTATNSVIDSRKLTITGDNGYFSVIDGDVDSDIAFKEGEYTFTLEVENDHGKTDSMTKSITVKKQEPDSDPIAIVNAPSSAPIGQEFQVDALSSMASQGAKVVEFDWYIGDSEDSLEMAAEYQSQDKFNVSYDNQGIKYFQVRITDTNGKSATSNIASTKIVDHVISTGMAKINVPEVGYEGVPFYISSSGSKVIKDGETFSLFKAVELGYASYRYTASTRTKRDLDASGGEMTMYELGDQQVHLTVIPRNNPKDKATGYIEILPTPKADLTIKGELKENRRIEIDGLKSLYHERHSYVVDDTYFIIEEVSTGQAVKIDYQQSVNNPFMRSKPRDEISLETIFKKPGKYKITYFTTDDRGNTDQTAKTITIREDKPPVSSFFTEERVFRDPDRGYALIELISKSDSSDDDYIDFREYSYKLDSNNDGSFDDENWVYIGQTQYIRYTFSLNDVGKYLIRERVRERFASQTIEEFVTPEDRKESESTYAIEVDNKEPIASFNPITSKDIDIMLNYNKEDQTTVTNAISIYEDAVINDAESLIRPNTFKNEFINADGPLIQIKQGKLSDYRSIRKEGENEDYLVLSLIYENPSTGRNSYSSILIRKEDFAILADSRQGDTLLARWGDRRLEDEKYNPQKYTELFLGNTNYIWLNDRLYDASNRTEHLLEYPIHGDQKPFYVDEKNNYFYYLDVNRQIIQYDLNNHTSKMIPTEESGSNYSIVHADEDSIFLLNKRFYQGTNNPHEAKIEIIKVDFNGNIINRSTKYSPTNMPTTRDWRVENHEGHQFIYYDEQEEVIYINLEIMKQEYRDGDKYQHFFRLLKVDKSGDFTVKEIDHDADQWKRGCLGCAYGVDFQLREDGEFQLTTFRRSTRELKRINYDKDGNISLKHRSEDSNSQAPDHISNYRFWAFNGYDGYKRRDYAAIKDTDTDEEHIRLYNNCTNCDNVFIRGIENAPNEFYVYNNRNREYYLYNALTGERKTLPRFHSSDKKAVATVIKNENYYFFVHSYTGTRYIFKDEGGTMTEVPFSPINGYLVSGLIISENNRYLTFYRERSIEPYSIEYDHYLINPTFFELTEKIKKMTFENDDRYVVIFENQAISTGEEQEEELIQAIKDQNAKIIFFGNLNHKALANRIIAETGGYFRNFSSYENMMTELASVLKLDNNDLSDREQSIYIKKGEYISYERIFKDYENDPQHTISGERWRYVHDPHYFNDNNGYAAFHNQWLTEPVNQFDKVGKYTVTIQLKDNPVGSDHHFDDYRKWSSESRSVDIIVYDEDIKEPEDVPPSMDMTVSGDFRENRRIDFVITPTRGSHDIDLSSLDITFNGTDSLPYAEPETLQFSRVFKNTGTKKITVTLADTEGNTVTEEYTIEIEEDLPPVASMTLTGDGKRAEDGNATFTITNRAQETDDGMGPIEYFIQGQDYIDNGDGTMSPNGTTYLLLNVEDGKIELSSVGTHRIKQRVTDYYTNGTGLNGENLDPYRVFKRAEVIREVEVINEPPELTYQVKPNLILIGEDIAHIEEVKDDLISGYRTEYKFLHDESYYQNNNGKDPNHDVITEDPAPSLDYKGKYTFYARTIDADGAMTDWVEGGKVIVASEPVADFELTSSAEYGNNYFRSGRTITIQNQSYNEDYAQTIPNHGIEYLKVEYRDAASDIWTVLWEQDNMPNYESEFEIPEQSNGIYEVRMTVRSPEGYEDVKVKHFGVLEFRLDAELDPETIITGESYTIRVSVSKDAQGVVAKVHDENYVTLNKIDEDSSNEYYEITVDTENTLPDGEYPITVYAMYPFNQEKSETLTLTVDTPINLQGYIEGKAQDALMVAGKNNEVAAMTSIYVNDVKAQIQGYNHSLNLISDDGERRYWQTNVYIPQGTPEGWYMADFTATTTNMSVGTAQVNYELTWNRPPEADFTWTPEPPYEGDTIQIQDRSSDPDQDPLIYDYIVRDPEGNTRTFLVDEPQFRATIPGMYRVTQKVTDPVGETDSVTKNIHVAELMMTGNVDHTDNWKAIHTKLGNTQSQFYSGEKFLLQAEVTDQPIDYVKVDFEGKQVDEAMMTLSTTLSPTTSANWQGSLYDEAMTEPSTRLKKGSVRFTFTVKYSNGRVKQDTVTVQIIGSAYEALDYHRTN